FRGRRLAVERDRAAADWTTARFWRRLDALHGQSRRYRAVEEPAQCGPVVQHGCRFQQEQRSATGEQHTGLSASFRRDPSRWPIAVGFLGHQKFPDYREGEDTISSRVPE